MACRFLCQWYQQYAGLESVCSEHLAGQSSLVVYLLFQNRPVCHTVNKMCVTPSYFTIQDSLMFSEMFTNSSSIAVFRTDQILQVLVSMTSSFIRYIKKHLYQHSYTSCIFKNRLKEITNNKKWSSYNITVCSKVNY